jgi:hypothetical protein
VRSFASGAAFPTAGNRFSEGHCCKIFTGRVVDKGSEIHDPAPLGEWHKNGTLGSKRDVSALFVAAGPVSRIRRVALQTNNLFRISRREVSMMSTLAVMVGSASHWRHNGRCERIACS